VVSIKKSIASKLLWTILAAFVFYLIGSSLNIIPQPIKDLVAWLGTNFNTIIFFLCFLLVFYLILKFTKNKKKGFQQ
jgi:hypothetical protein